MTKPTRRRSAHATGLHALLILALAAGLVGLVGPTRASAQAQGGSVTIASEISGNAGVRSGQAVVVSGTAPPGAALTSAVLVGLESDGRERQTDMSGAIGLPRDDTGNWLSGDGGQLRGRLVLNCLFSEPTPGCPFPHDDIVAVVLRLGFTGGTTLDSAPLLVDYTQPVFLHYTVVAPTEIVVRFSEPVRLGTGSLPPTEVPTDYSSPDDVRILQVLNEDCGTGNGAPNHNTPCQTRRLRTTTIAEDATPEIRYEPSASRPKYEDLTSNPVRRGSSTNAWSSAIDAIRPPIPRIDSVGGVTPTAGNVATAERAPRVALSNLTSGHEVQVRVNGVTDTAATAAAPGATGTFTLSTLTAAGTDRDGLTVTAVAIDPNGNRSDDTSGPEPTRADGSPNPVRVDVDDTIPVPVSAVRRAPNQVEVRFSEVVSPATAGTWRVGAQTPTAVESSAGGASRILTLPATVGLTDTVAWEPSGGSALRDRVGHPVAAFGAFALREPQPLPDPRVTLPAGTVITRDRAVTMAGTAPQADTVEVFDAADALLATVPADPTTTPAWTTGLTLPDADGTHRFSVQSRSAAGGLSSRQSSPAIILDRVAPTVDITAPVATTGPVGLGNTPPTYGVGDTVQLVVDLADDHFASATIVLALPGKPPVQADTVTQPGTVSRTIGLPDDAEAGDGTITVTATDQAGNQASDQVTIRIDPQILSLRSTVLASNTTARTEVVLTFAGDLTGTSVPLEWRAGDGVNDNSEQNRRPIRTTVSGPTVTLAFPTPFPGPANGNAAPLVSLEQSLGTLAGADGRRVSVRDRIAADVTPPLLVTPPVAPSGPVNLVDDVLLVSGASDAAHEHKPNTVTIRVTTNDHTGPAVSGLTQPNGQFSVAVPVPPNAMSTASIVVTDPAGLTTAPHEIAVTEDSDPPGMDVLTVTADPAGTRGLITYALDEPVTQARFEYRAGKGEWLPVATVAPGNPDRASGTVDWPGLADVDRSEGVTVRGLGTDLAGNTDESAYRYADLRLFVDLVAARATGPRTVEVTVEDAVTTTRSGAAGFSVLSGGPGVSSVRADGTTLTLTLNRDLVTATPVLAHNGLGGWTTASGRLLREGTVAATRAFVFPPTGLASRPGVESGAAISFVDARNQPEWVTGYEVARDGEVIATLPSDGRALDDPEAVDGPHLYAVTTIGTDGLRSGPVTTSITVGEPPDLNGTEGGTSFPVGSVVLEDCPFPATPNLTVEGGTLLSCDDKAAVLVPAGAVSGPAFGKIIRRTVVPTDGFHPVSELYQVVVVAADGTTVDAFARYADLSFRGAVAELDSVTAERVAVLRPSGLADLAEMPTRVTPRSVAAAFLTVGSFGVAEADGVTLRVYGPDPAVITDRFATAAGLSQVRFRDAGTVVLARADDYPDALSASALAAFAGGPVLLTRPGDLPSATLLELVRLDATDVVIVGGEAAVSAAVVARLEAEGLRVERIAGPDRFATAAAVASRVGATDGAAFLAVGTNFADALAAAGPSAAMGHPILLTGRDALPDATSAALASLLIQRVHIVGGEAAVSAAVADSLRAAGIEVRRSAGPTRYETALALASDLVADGATRMIRPLVASGVGDGITSPDALASGPLAGWLRAPLLLTPPTEAPAGLTDFIAGADDLRGILLAGGPAAVSPAVRTALDAAATDAPGD